MVMVYSKYSHTDRLNLTHRRAGLQVFCSCWTRRLLLFDLDQYLSLIRWTGFHFSKHLHPPSPPACSSSADTHSLSLPCRYSEFSALDNRTQTAAQDICTQAANMAGVGAVSVPVGMSREGLPLALQLMAPWGQDDALLAAAKWIEQHVNFPRLCIL